MSNPTKFSKLGDLAALIAERQRFDKLSHEERKHERLNQLRAFVRQLAETPQGRRDLEERVRLLGPCDPGPEENAASYYGRLRRWLDADLTARAAYAATRR